MGRRLVLVAASVLAAACGGSTPNTVAVYPVYQFTCCVSEDVNQTWRPGQTIELRWIVKQGAPSVSSTPHPVTLFATMYGPYSDVESLKKAGGTGAWAIQGSVVKTNDRTSSQPISTFILPSSLPPGYYNLMFADDFGSGHSANGAMVIRVGSG